MLKKPEATPQEVEPLWNYGDQKPLACNLSHTAFLDTFDNIDIPKTACFFSTPNIIYFSSTLDPRQRYLTYHRTLFKKP